MRSSWADKKRQKDEIVEEGSEYRHLKSKAKGKRVRWNEDVEEKEGRKWVSSAAGTRWEMRKGQLRQDQMGERQEGMGDTLIERSNAELGHRGKVGYLTYVVSTRQTVKKLSWYQLKRDIVHTQGDTPGGPKSMEDRCFCDDEIVAFLACLWPS